MQSKIYDNRKCEKSHFLFLCNKKFLQNFLLHKNRSTRDAPLHKRKNIAKAICAEWVECRKRHSLIHNKKFQHRITELCYNFYRLKKIGGNMFKLGFIGMGNMGSAILNGVSKLYNKDDVVFHSSTKKKNGKDK